MNKFEIYNGYVHANEDNTHLIQVKIKSLRTLNPVKKTNYGCTILFLSNLAYPQWLSTNCNETILNHVVCFKRFKDNKTALNYHTDSLCAKGTVI